MKTNKALLEQELKLRYEEYDALHEVMSQTKTDLFRSMMEQRHLQSQLCKEQRLVQSLKTQKNLLINEVSVHKHYFAVTFNSCNTFINILDL